MVPHHHPQREDSTGRKRVILRSPHCVGQQQRDGPAIDMIIVILNINEDWRLPDSEFIGQY